MPGEMHDRSEALAQTCLSAIYLEFKCSNAESAVLLPE